MRILLVSPNTLTAPYPVYPLGLDYVAASVSPEHEVRIADLNVLSLSELDDILITVLSTRENGSAWLSRPLTTDIFLQAQ